MLAQRTKLDDCSGVMPMNSLLKAVCLALVAAFALAAEPRASHAGSAADLEAEANETLHSFVRQVAGARELANKAAGILVFPSVVKAGIGIGGEYGEGILLNQKQVQGYYNLISASFGFQLGVHDPGRARRVPAQGGMENRRRRLGDDHYGRRQRFDRQRGGRESRHRLRAGPGGPHVQSDARGHEDQPHGALDVAAFYSNFSPVNVTAALPMTVGTPIQRGT